MKKFFKKFSLIIVIAICFGLAGPLMTPLRLFAYTIPTNYELKIESGIIVPKFKSEGTINIPYEIAPGYVIDPDTHEEIPVTVSVRDDYGNPITLNGNFFTPEIAVPHYITYTHDNQSTDLIVNITGNTKGIEITFEENSEQIVPSIINPKNGNEGLRVILPNPTVLDSSKNVISEATVERTLYFTGSGTSGIDYELLLANTAENEENFDILVMNPDSNGTYTISYKYMHSGKLIAYNSKVIKADKGYNNDFEFTYNYDSNIPTSAEIGVETKLPTITAKNKTTVKEEVVEVYYTVKAQITVGTTTTYELNDGTGVITFKEGKFHFKPVKDGDYIITYIVKNFFGKTPTMSSTSFDIDDVSDTRAPQPLVVMPYTEDDFENGVLDYIDATEALASYNDLENILIFPIYAKDDANGIVEDNLTLFRTLKRANGIVIFNESTDMPEADKDLNVNGKILVIKSTLLDFDSKGDNDTVLTVYLKGKPYNIKKSEVYIVPDDALQNSIISATHTVSYIAKDKSKATNIVNENYTMILEDGFDDDEAPVVTFSENLPPAILLGEEVEFATPTASDNKDSRLSVYITYILTTEEGDSEEIRADADNSIISYNEDTKTYSFKLTDDDDDILQVKIIAHSRDNSEKVGSAEQVVLVVQTGDTVVTTIQSTNIYLPQNEDKYVQGNEIVLPTVVYNDDLVDYLNIEIIIKNNDTILEARNSTIVRSGTTLTISNAMFLANAAGDYTITYISTDAGKNKTILVFNLVIEINPEDIVVEFTGLDTQINKGKAERGETIKLPIPNLTYDKTVLKLVGEKYRVEISGPTNYERYANYFFTPKEIGTYYIKYVAEFTVIGDPDYVFEPVESRTFTIVVTDTVGPVFEDFNKIESYFADLNAVGVEPGTSLDIPLPEYYTSNDVNLVASYVSISTSTAPTYTVHLNEPEKLTNCNRFTRDDTYTITYVLIDNYNNETKKTITLNVGDCEPPLITPVDLFEPEYAINSKIILDLSKITIYDEVDGDILISNPDPNNPETQIYSILDNASFSITIKNVQTGAELENDWEIDSNDLRFQFTIKTAGEYKVTIEAKDTAGKTKIEELTFIVAADDNMGMTAEEVLGTILIIISVIMLGGVITYFVVSKKKLENKYKK